MLRTSPWRTFTATPNVLAEPLAHVITQMDALLAGTPDPENETAVAVRELVRQWRAMLQRAEPTDDEVA